MKDEDFEARRKELEISLANHYHMTDSSKYRLINKIMNLLEEEMEEDMRYEDD